MVDKAPVYPGIVPVIQYQYDMTRAGWPMRRLGPMTSLQRYLWPQQCRFLDATALYTLVKYRTPMGAWRTADAAALLHPIYDFCGGMIASSGSLSFYNHPDNTDKWSGFRYRRQLLGPKEIKRGKPFYSDSGKATEWATVEHMLPDLKEYTGLETHEDALVHTILNRSMGAGIVTAARALGRRGVFAADIHAGGRIHPMLSAMDGPGPRYNFNATVHQWAKQNGLDERCLVQGVGYRPVIYGKGTYTPGTPYINPNTGRMVSMSTLLFEDYNASNWTMPPAEQDKFHSADFAYMCPQGLFHN